VHCSDAATNWMKTLGRRSGRRLENRATLCLIDRMDTMGPTENGIRSTSESPSPDGSPLRTFAGGVWRLVWGVLVLTAYGLVGASACMAHGMVRGGGRVLEEILGGTAIGVMSAALRITGYHRAAGVGVAALLGWVAGFALGLFMLAPAGALLGGLLVALIPGRPGHQPMLRTSEAPLPRRTAPGILSLLLGMVVG
jgi:hypothetical protein